MMYLLYAATSRTLSNRHKNAVSLTEFGIVQAIKYKVNVNLKRAVQFARLSHVFSDCREMKPTRGSQLLRWLARCFWRTLATDALFSRGA
jgi:hypothetical protein